MSDDLSIGIHPGEQDDDQGNTHPIVVMEVSQPMPRLVFSVDAARMLGQLIIQAADESEQIRERGALQ